jgi:RimJ/RimL family protein N-acetyltransferase
MLVRLRPLSPDDVPAITNLLRDDRQGIMQTARIPWPFTEADAAAFVQRAVSESEAAWAIEEAASGALAGAIGATPGTESEIGYWIGEPFRGRGMASDAIRLIVERLRGLGVRKVRAHVFPENPASSRALVKNGFVRTGQIERDMPLRGGVRKLDIYELDLP